MQCKHYKLSYLMLFMIVKGFSQNNQHARKYKYKKRFRTFFKERKFCVGSGRGKDRQTPSPSLLRYFADLHVAECQVIKFWKTT
jgi:hypothetical protein